MEVADKLKEPEEYVNILLNVENKWDGNLINVNVEAPYERFVKEDVRKAVSSMKTGKAAGPSGIASGLLKLCGKGSVRILLKVSNGFLKREKKPDSWKLSDLIPIHKHKGDVKLCGSYRRVKLLEHGIKVM